jgi:hypothetical protein
MRAMTEIKNLKDKCGLFREFCKINDLKDGDYYSAVDYHYLCPLYLFYKLLRVLFDYRFVFVFDSVYIYR